MVGAEKLSSYDTFWEMLIPKYLNVVGGGKSEVKSYCMISPAGSLMGGKK